MQEVFKAIPYVTNMYTLGAFAIAAIVVIVSIVLKKRGRVASLPLVTTTCVVVALVMAVGYWAFKKDQTLNNTIYRVRVTVTDERNIPVDDAKLWSSVGGEPKRVAGGWEFDIPRASTPENGVVNIYASKDEIFLSGVGELALGNDRNPTLTLLLTKKELGSVRGVVQDETGRSVPGVRVSIRGYDSEAQVTPEGGDFLLPAHAGIHEQILLHAEKSGYKPATQWHPAGEEPAIVVIERK